MSRLFKIVEDAHRKHSNVDIVLPRRGTLESSGYDFYLPIDVNLQPGERTMIALDVKAQMNTGEVLLLFIRSSVGIKKGLMITNGTGVIDGDYYGNIGNDGNIHVALVNTTGKPVMLSKGDRVAQGIFMNYLITDDDKPLSEERIGGIGSTGGK